MLLKTVIWFLTLLGITPVLLVTFSFLSVVRSIRLEETSVSSDPPMTESQIQQAALRGGVSFRFPITASRYSTPIRIRPSVLAVGLLGAICILAFTFFTFRGSF